jgi:predicted 3-demethylubiquinone-9 3-methyltransferase (glyoxalase superfamily)
MIARSYVCHVHFKQKIQMQKITPFLWLDGNVEEAINFYVSVFKNSKVGSVNRQGKEGPVMSATFTLENQDFIAFNGGPMFKFTEAISLFVDCKDQRDVDELWSKLTADGGKESMCGWLEDRFGLWWQIIPKTLGQMLSDKDQVKAQRVVQAMLKMKKIDIKELTDAYDGKA